MMTMAEQRRKLRAKRVYLPHATIDDVIEAVIHDFQTPRLIFVLARYPADAASWVKKNKVRGRLYAHLRNVDQLENAKPPIFFVSVENYEKSPSFAAIRARLVELRAVCMNI